MVSNTINAEVQPSKRQASEPARRAQNWWRALADHGAKILILNNCHITQLGQPADPSLARVPCRRRTRARKSEVLTVIDGVIGTAPFLVAY